MFLNFYYKGVRLVGGKSSNRRCTGSFSRLYIVWLFIPNTVILVGAALTNSNGLLAIAASLLSVLDKTIIR